ncbi:LysR family transcriptional regulator [Paraburkholderia sp. EG286A]|uniref:LysR family transcriptional regulator n=1 Tax=Paraburkholderia sp. EG286A TaxID=3237014 RepID=UPI0034D2EC93
MDLLRSIRIFKRVADAASFTAAARQLEITTAQASRAIADLEVHLRTRLLHRTTRRVAITEAGNRYLQRCGEICTLMNSPKSKSVRRSLCRWACCVFTRH